MTRSIPCMSRSALLLPWKLRLRWRICQPSATSTARPRARPATAIHARRSFLASGLAGGNGNRLGMAISVDGAHRRGALTMDREIANSRVLAAQRALRVAPQLDFAETHAERVVGEETADQRLTDAQEQLHRLGGLHDADDAWEHAQDAGLASGGDEAGRWRRGIEAAIARSLVGREDRGHALELEDGAVDIGLAGQIAGVVDEVARVEVVRAVDDEIVVFDDVHHVVYIDAHRQLDDVRVRVEGLDGLSSRVHLGPAHARRGVKDLALEIRYVQHVSVHEADGAHACRRQVERGRRSEAARSDEEHLGAEELALPLLAHLCEEEMAAVPLDLVARERRVLHHGQARLRPALEPTLEVDHVRVAEVVERLGREHRAKARLAVEHYGGGRLGSHGADPELEEAAADVRRGLDGPVAILIGIPHIDHRYGFGRVEPLLELGRWLLRNDLPSLRQHFLQRLHVLAP